MSKFQPGSNALIITLAIATAVTFGGAIASMIFGSKGMDALKANPNGNQALPFLMMLGALLLIVGAGLGYMTVNNIVIRKTGQSLIRR